MGSFRRREPMHDPYRILVVGDLHGDPQSLQYIFETAHQLDVQAIVQIGDYGFWEHHPAGGAFLDLTAEGVQISGIPFLWLDGNHESHTLLRSKYGPGGPEHCPTWEGFWEIRTGVYYLPRGVRWSWNGHRFMALGGAYSIDKAWRLAQTARDGAPRWWPEEELTDAEVEAAINQREEFIDVLFTHDKPFAATVPWDKGIIPATLPNQHRIQKVVDALKPLWVVHGHLHYHYQDHIPGGPTVIGLNCNLNDRPTVLAGSPRAWAMENPEDAWVVMDLDKPVETLI